MSEASPGDLALPIDVQPAPVQPVPEETAMPALSIGAALRVPDLAGRWSVWSQSDETPGGFYLVPLDDMARTVGVKYVVIRAVMKRGSSTPTLTLVRTDPHIAGLVK